ncbi:MAG: AAA family ATPase [Planctomycetota bacterium]|nr:AAA family ATPase [Planctomycetota bacterium]
MTDSKETPKSPEELQKELQDFIQKFGGDVVAFPNSPMAPEAGGSPEAEKTEEPEIPEAVLDFDMTPTQVKAYLDRFVIGQDEAKRTLSVAVCDHYNHVKRVLGTQEKSEASAANPSSEYVKQNVILLGPTGVGKTYLIRILAQLIGVPFVKADVTKFSETGYVGGDVDDLVRELVRMSDGNARVASHGIVFLDEIDKIAGAQTSQGRDPSGRGVQVGLLKLMEETEVNLRNPMDISAHLQSMMQGGGAGGPSTINTRHILFVVSGAFSGIDQIIEKRMSEHNIGFGAPSRKEQESESSAILQDVKTRDFVEYGFEPEFIGRLPVRVALDELTDNDLFRILLTSEGSILKQYRQSFQDYGIDIAFEDSALQEVASKAADEKTGARGLMSVLESCLRNFKFNLPGTRIDKLAMTASLVQDPEKVLGEVIEDPTAAATEYYLFIVREFEAEFARRHGVMLSLDDEAVPSAASLANEKGLPVKDYLWEHFSEHVDFLQKICEQAGSFELAVTPAILASPGCGAETWLTSEDKPASSPE